MVYTPSFSAGLLWAVASAITFGTSSLFMRLKSLSAANVHPLVMQLYFALSCLVWSLPLLLLDDKFTFTTWGLLGAAIWTPATTFAVFAITLVGITASTALWAGITVIISFFWGAFVFHDPVHSIALSVLALTMILVGIMGTSDTLRRASRKSVYRAPATEDESESASLRAEEEAVSLTADGDNTEAASMTLGLLCAVAMGFLNGSLLVPTKLLPTGVSVFSYALSFAIGAVALMPGYFLLYCFVVSTWFPQSVSTWISDTKDKPQLITVFKTSSASLVLPPFHLGVALLPGMAAGLFWAAGNLFSMLAVLSPLGLTIGYPLTQCALLVSGFWGIFLFGEIQGFKLIVRYSIFAAVLIAGAGVLAVYG